MCVAVAVAVTVTVVCIAIAIRTGTTGGDTEWMRPSFPITIVTGG